MNKLSPAIAALARLMGITDRQAREMMPGDDGSTAGFPGAIMRPEEDNAWAEDEHRKGVLQLERGYKNARKLPRGGD